jgi:predicted DNA-binding antitoxin AbrB/MazE fold protein
MVSIQGIIKNGVVEPLEPIEGQEGQKVTIALTEKKQEDDRVMTNSDWEQLNQLLEECQMDIPIDDLAHQHDHLNI